MELSLILILVVATMWKKMADGQSMSSDGCYQVYPNSKVNCVNSYKSQVVASEQQCRDLCTQGAPQCQSAQFATASRQCDLFNNFIPPGAAGRRKRYIDLVERLKRGTYVAAGNYRPPQTYPAPAPSYRPPQTYPAPAPRPAQTYSAPKPAGYAACGGYGPTVQGIGGYTYCKPTGNCPQTPPPPPVTSPPTPPPACPAGQVLRYYKAAGFKLEGSPDFTFNTADEQACITACTNNQQASGTAAMCKSVDFNTQTKQCQIFTSQALAPSGSAAATADANTNHYEKVCVDSGLGRCQGPYFIGPQMILIGFAQTVTTASSMSECLGLCANSQSRFGFSCLSGMFYFQETSNNCILNSESRTTHPDLYNPETQDKVNYFEPGCAAARFLRAALREVRNRNVLQLDTPDFGSWTLCDHKILGHKRFKRCSTLNPSKCTRDENICDPKREDEYDLQIVQPVKPPKNTPSKNESSSGNSAQAGTTQNNGGHSAERLVTKTIKKESAFQQVQARDSGHSQQGPILPAGICFPLFNLDGTKDCLHGTMFTSTGKRQDCVPTFAECGA